MSTASTVEREMLALINQERTSRGLDPLQLERRLNDSSEDHSSWMLDTDRFSHTGEGGSSATQRMQAAGFDLSGSWRTGENIAWQSERGAPGISDDVAQLHQNLMNSPGHRANILNPDFKYIGIGIEEGDMRGFDAVMVTQNFAATQGEVVLDTGGTAPPVAPPVEEVVEPEEEVTKPIEPEVPETDVTEGEDPEPETPETDITEVEEPQMPDSDVVDVDEPETPDTGVTDVEDLEPETPEIVVDDGAPGADCFDVQAFLAGIEAVVNALQAHFDQFEWAPVQQADITSEMDDIDLMADTDIADDIIETVETTVEDMNDDMCGMFVFEMNCGFDWA